VTTGHTHTDECLLLPGNPLPAQIRLARPLPGFVILVHGVNDLGETYAAQEAGLCAGLNQRLRREDLRPARYRLPPARDDPSPAAQKELHAVLDDPDAVYYRRSVDPASAWNPVVPFYWGSRTSDPLEIRNHLRVDRAGNRVDANGAKEGGPFANATNNLVDLWSKGFEGVLGFLDLNKASGQPTHPLLNAGERRYMVLAAQRLAMLVDIIHKRNSQSIVNLVCHSQGCMLALLAQAILGKQGKPPADCLILNHPPYSLEEPLLELLTQSGGRQQTTRARVATLGNLVQLVTRSPQTRPALATLLDPSRNGGLTGPLPGPEPTPGPGPFAVQPPPAAPVPVSLLEQARRAGILGEPKDWRYPDRDNRGRVFLYFCPEDATVGLDSIQGIGWQGVPEHKDGQPVLAALGPRFHQRVWTLRARKGIVPKVGEGTHHVLREPHERFWSHLNASWRATPAERETRVLASGMSLPAPYQANLRFGESRGQAGFLDVGPCDAATAVTNQGGQKTIHTGTGEALPLSRMDVEDGRAGGGGVGHLGPRDLQQLENRLNAGKGEDDRIQVLSAEGLGNGKLKVDYLESDKAARIRWQTREVEANSYHSAIVANPEHSRHVTAWDLAIGPARICTNQSKATSYREWVEETTNYVRYLCTVADWRMTPDDLQKKRTEITLCSFFDEDTEHSALINATANYFRSGILPDHLLVKPMHLKPWLQSETITERLERAAARVRQAMRLHA
jgi:hypothetical protein